MKCLSIFQPWADLVVFGAKFIENRTWEPKTFRGGLLIQAAKFEDKSPWAVRASHPFYHGVYGRRPELLERLDKRGSVIGRARLLGVISAEEARRTYPEQEPFIAGPCCWVLEARQAIRKPFEVRGMVGLFDVACDWDDALFERLRE